MWRCPRIAHASHRTRVLDLPWQWDVPKALLMFRKHLEWRTHHHLDTMADSDMGPVPRLLVDLRYPALAEVS